MGKKLFFFFGLILLVSFLGVGVLANFDYISNEIVTSYSAGEIIRGEFNMSFDSEETTSLLESNFEGDITLLGFLEANDFIEGVDYTCNFLDCSDKYVGGNSLTNIQLSNEGTLTGFKVTGSEINAVSSAKFTVGGGIPETCNQNQLLIDFFDSDTYAVTNNQYVDTECAETYGGCFEEDEDLTEATVGNNYYCEKMTMPMAPAYKLSAKIKNETSYSGSTLKISLYSANEETLGQLYGECELSEHTENVGFEKLGCVVPYSTTKQQDYFVCLRTDGDSDFKIQTETNNPCGGANANSGGTLNRDFDISAKRMKFAEIASLEINEESFGEAFDGSSLSGLITTYLFDEYSGSCEQGCVVPIRFSGDAETTAYFSDIKINYLSSSTELEDDKFYEISFSTADITSEELTLEMSYANFEIPIGSEAEEFEFYLDDSLVFEEDITISESFDFDVSPNFAAFGQEVTFRANTSEDITSSTWKFGDGSASVTVSGKEVRHTYLEQDVFSMEVEITRADGITAKRIFSIIVGDARVIANITIDDYEERIASLGPIISSYPDWIRTELEKKIDLSKMTSSLNTIKENYESASSDEDYQNVMLQLLNPETILIPKEISITKQGAHFPLILGFSNMDPSYIEDLSGKTAESKSELKESIAGWMNTFYDSTISFEQISAVYNHGSDVLMTKFEIRTNPVKDIKDDKGVDYEPYLILGYKIEEAGKFKQDYGQKPIGGSATYLSLESEEIDEIFEFLVLTEFEPENFGAYISPTLQKLNLLGKLIEDCNFDTVCESDLGENKETCPADCESRWGWFTVWQIFILFGFLITYIVLQEWYKKHYEGYLFKNKDDLYNMINFIYNSRKNQLTNPQISGKLSSSGWNHEKITFALKKIDGKRTGMYEIPLFKFLENKKVKKEIEKRQGAPIDTRFIKQRGSKF